MTVPLVSFLIPVHNGVRYLRESIESALAQSVPDLEILVVDDGSNDGSGDVADDCAIRDGRVRVLRQAHEGKAAALNWGLVAARGRWVAMLDADDVCSPDRIATQLAFAEGHPGLAVVASNSYYIGETGRILGLYELGPTTAAEFETLIRRNEAVHFLHSTTMVDRDVVLNAGGYDHRFGPAEDLELYNRLADRGYMSLALKQPKVLYRVHDRSLMMATHRHAFQMTRYTMEFVVARRRGSETISFEEFVSRERAAPWPRQLRCRMRDYAALLYRRSGVEIGRGRIFRGGLTAALAGMLAPSYVYGKLRRQIVPDLKWTGRGRSVAALLGRSQYPSGQTRHEVETRR